MKDSFPVDFYAVSATVIPVLFLAFAVQGPFIERWRKEALKSSKASSLETLWKEMQAPPRKSSANAHTTIAGWLAFVGAITLVAGVLGEIWALGALFTQYDNTSHRIFTLVSVIVLLLAVAAVPIYVLLTPFIGIIRDNQFFYEVKAKLEKDEPQAPDDQGQGH